MSKKKHSHTSKKTIRHDVAGKVVHASTAVEPTHEQIAMRAYAIFEAEGRPHGRHLEHWSLAATELRK